MARTNQQAEEPSQPEVTASERLTLNLSEAQRITVLRYAKLPDDLAKRLSMPQDATSVQFTLDELDALLDELEIAVSGTKGNEKQKVLRIVQKVAGLLGSKIVPYQLPKRWIFKKAPTIFQIKMTLKGIDPPIWRRIQTGDCTLEELH